MKAHDGSQAWSYNESVRCLSCKYDLSHLAEHRCPECSRPFDPTDMLTFICDEEMYDLTVRPFHWVMAVWWLVCLLLLCVRVHSGSSRLDYLLAPIVVIGFAIILIRGWCIRNKTYL